MTNTNTNSNSDTDAKLFTILQKSLSSESTINTYKKRLNSLNEMCKNSGFMYFLTNPKSVYKRMLIKYPGTTATRANLITAITKMFSTNPELLKEYKTKYEIWKQFLKKERNQENARYDTNKPNDKQLNSIVDYEDVVTTYNEVRKQVTNGFNDKTHNLEFVLLSILINLRPKRADLGNIIFVKKDPKPKMQDRNYIILNGTPQLVMNKYKMAHQNGVIIEDINPQLQEDILLSLKHYPRKYLFVDKNGNPYENNAYGLFVQRTFYKYFGKRTGVSLWRHIHITKKINPLIMPNSELKKEAKLMGHRVSSQQSVYLWKNIKKTS